MIIVLHLSRVDSRVLARASENHHGDKLGQLSYGVKFLRDSCESMKMARINILTSRKGTLSNKVSRVMVT